MNKESLEEIKESVLEDLNKFTNIIKELENNFIISLLADIIAKTATKNEDGTKNYDNFDEKVKTVKTFLNNVNYNESDIPDLIKSVKEDMERIERTRTECSYSMRTLEWVKELIEEEEKENA